MLVFILQSVVFILWLLVIASSPSSSCPTLVWSRDTAQMCRLIWIFAGVHTSIGMFSDMVAHLYVAETSWITLCLLIQVDKLIKEYIFLLLESTFGCVL